MARQSVRRSKAATLQVVLPLQLGGLLLQGSDVALVLVQSQVHPGVRGVRLRNHQTPVSIDLR